MYTWSKRLRLSQTERSPRATHRAPLGKRPISWLGAVFFMPLLLAGCVDRAVSGGLNPQQQEAIPDTKVIGLPHRGLRYPVAVGRQATRWIPRSTGCARWTAPIGRLDPRARGENGASATAGPAFSNRASLLGSARRPPANAARSSTGSTAIGWNFPVHCVR